MASDAEVERGRTTRWDAGLTLLAALIAFARDVFALAAAPVLLDSAEFASASFSLGIAHPPGEPLALLLGKLCSFLPVGSVAFRVGLSQTVATAAATALVFRIALDLLDAFDAEARLDPRAHRVLALAAALGFTFAPGVVQAAIRPEVYAVATLLALAALRLALRARRTGDPRLALLGALLIGLGLGNHPLIAGAAGTGAVAAALPLLAEAAIPRVRLVAISIVALAVGAAVIAYLPLRALALATGSVEAVRDTVVWGDATNGAGLWWILSARTFVDKAVIVHRAEDPGSLPFVLMEEVSLPGLLLAGVGLYGLLRRRSTRACAVAVAATIGGVVAAALTGGLDPDNPDIRGYLGATLALVPALAATGVGFGLWLLRHRTLQRAIGFGVLLVVLGQGMLSAGATTLRNRRAAYAIATETLSSLPSHAVLLTGHFESAFLLSYARAVEGRRADVAWAHLGFARGPGAFDRFARAEPDLAPVLRAHLGGPLSLTLTRQLADRRPLRIEANDDLGADLVRALRPAPLAWALDGPSELQDMPPSLAGLDPEMARSAWREAEDDQQTRGFLVWRLFLDTRLACAAHRPEAPRYVSLLNEKAPGDTMARTLAASCR